MNKKQVTYTKKDTAQEKKLKKVRRKRKRLPASDSLELRKTQISNEVWIITSYMSFWKSKVEHPENIADWVLPNQRMTAVQACREYWIPMTTFFYHLNTFPDLKQKYIEIREQIREGISTGSESIIEKAINWKLDWISNKDRLDASFRFLEKTHKAYNPKTEIESKTLNINLDVSKEDIIEELWKIFNKQN